MKDGILDAGTTSATAALGQRWYEVSDYINGPLSFFFNTNNVINKSVWDNIPQDLQQILMEEGAKSELEGLRLSAIQNEIGVERSVQAGLEVVAFSQELLDQSDNAVMNNVIPSWIRRVGGTNRPAIQLFNEKVGPRVGLFIEPNGSVSRRVTASATIEADEWIVYGTVVPDSGTSEPAHLTRIRPDGSGLLQLTSSSSFNRYPSWSPNKKRIAFMRKTTSDDNPTGDIFVIDPDGTGLQRLTEAGDFMYPDWSPSGDRIIFDGWTTGIQIVSATGGDVTTIVSDNFVDFPDWSPDNRRIAYNNGNAGNLFIIDSDGTNPVSLGLVGRFSDWSPDGRTILFESGFDLFTTDPNGNNVVNLTADLPGEFTWPDWSPDGNRIVFSYRPEESEDWDLAVMNAGGGPITIIADSPFHELNPQW